MKNPIIDFSNESFPQGTITQYFSENPQLYSLTRGHSGWDIIPNNGKQAYGMPAYAMFDCDVIYTQNDPAGYGNHVYALRADGLLNIYGHFSKIFVKTGDTVRAGDLIAELGNSGFVVSGETPFWTSNPYAGTHLHVTFIPTRPFNPAIDPPGQTHIYPKHSLRYIHEGNGFLGAVNPAPYFADKEGRSFLLNKDLKRGDSGFDVTTLGEILHMEGLFAESDIIGVYGPKMQRALFNFQRRYNLVGPHDPYQGFYCGPKTRAQIKILYP